MDYLRSFTIGTSGPIVAQHFAPYYLEKWENQGFPFKTYSIALPIYYGLMSMLALYLGKRFNWSLEKRLFIT